MLWQKNTAAENLCRFISTVVIVSKAYLVHTVLHIMSSNFWPFEIRFRKQQQKKNYFSKLEYKSLDRPPKILYTFLSIFFLKWRTAVQTCVNMLLLNSCTACILATSKGKGSAGVITGPCDWRLLVNKLVNRGSVRPNIPSIRGNVCSHCYQIWWE